MKQTAVEWLEEIIYSEKEFSLWAAIKQAKEMEKQQIIDAYDKGDENGAKRVYYRDNRDDVSGEQYYNETYKSE